MQTTVGRLLLDEALPEDLRSQSRSWDKKGVSALMNQVLESTPDRYLDILRNLERLGVETASVHGRQASLSLASLETPPEVHALREGAAAKIRKVLATEKDPAKRKLGVLKAVDEIIAPLEKVNYEQGLKTQNPFALQILSGSRGNAAQFRSLRGGDLLVTDHRNEPVPIPILSSYSEGLDPVQYFAATYGARQGAIALKMATPRAGYLAKQLALASHRLVITEKDCGTSDGIPVPASDMESEGSVLARATGGLRSGQVLHPRDLKELGNSKIVVRSPITCRAKKGICARCAGIRESGRFAAVGDTIENPGIASAEAASEPLSQSVISTKHTGALAGKKNTASGLDAIEKVINVPKSFAGSATVSEKDGRVEEIRPAPQGGQYVTVGGREHYVSPDLTLKVGHGDKIEAGDVLTDGIPNPAKVVEHKGVGAGRLALMETLRTVFKDAGVSVHRRHLEPMVRGLVNHVRITDLDGPPDTVPGDVVEYDDLARDYKPRAGTKTLHPAEAVGHHLERPVLHYSIGTRITPRVSADLAENGIHAVEAHEDPPSFHPEMVRAMQGLAYAADPMVRAGGLYGVRKSVMESAFRGGKSETHGVSYIPALAQGVDFGKSPDGKGY